MDLKNEGIPKNLETIYGGPLWLLRAPSILADSVVSELLAH